MMCCADGCDDVLCGWAVRMGCADGRENARCEDGL